MRSPPLLFEDRGFLLLDGVTREIISDGFPFGDITNSSKTNYILKTENKFSLQIDQSNVHDFQEAKELVLDHIIKKNRRKYKQYYGSRSYDRLFVPRRYDISFVRSEFFQIPIWYIDFENPEGINCQDVILGSSGWKWNELMYCPNCQSKIPISKSIRCQKCGKRVCHNCIREIGIIFRKKFCVSCVPE